MGDNLIFTISALDREINRCKALAWYHRNKGTLHGKVQADVLRKHELSLRRARRAYVRHQKGETL